MKGSSGKLIVNGENFLPSDSVVEINGTAITKLKYPSSYFLPSGMTTRIMTKRDVTEFLPLGVDVAITVYTPSADRRSEPILFRRDLATDVNHVLREVDSMKTPVSMLILSVLLVGLNPTVRAQQSGAVKAVN